MPLEIVPIPKHAYGKHGVVSVKFIEDVGRWKIQLNSHRAGLFCFTDRVCLGAPKVVIDDGLLRKKIRDPGTNHMFIFIAGELTPYESGPGRDARRINVHTRAPKSREEAFFQYLDTGKMIPESVSFFFGDENGKAWIQ